MTTQPKVCAICLVDGRPEMVKRAMRCFESQTYQRKSLLLYDTGSPMFEGDTNGFGHVMTRPSEKKKTIGVLRNEAIALCPDQDIIVHWDSDDWSHPARIEEQVQLLLESGKQCAGYEDLLFWDEIRRRAFHYLGVKNPAKVPGTSMCYWRSAWEQRKFAKLPLNANGTGEDSDWLAAIDSTARVGMQPFVWGGKTPLDLTDAPRMVALIHEGNTSNYEGIEDAYSWERIPHLDKFCAEVMSR